MTNNPHISTQIRAMRDAKIPTIPGAHILNGVTGAFEEHFVSKGYVLEPRVRITAKLDATVRFIGAPISVLKPYLLNDDIHSVGNVMVQHCVRTRNVKSLFDLSVLPRYGSFFTGMCALVPYSRLVELCQDTLQYLYDSLGLNEGEVRVNVYSKDKDLLAAAKSILPVGLIDLDTKPYEYYRHVYGIEGVTGRNFNFVVHNQLTGKYDDIGNMIVIEEGAKKIGVELALGDTTTTQQLLGLSHVQDNYGLEITSDHEAVKRRMEDAVLVTLVLYSEGLRPNNASNTQSRTLRSYMKSLSLCRQLLEMSYADLNQYLTALSVEDRLPFPVDRYSIREIVDWVEEYDHALSQKKSSENKEDLLVKKIIGIK